ncbi:MAG TPA: preprotein translocase subunit SecG [Candidatus Onthoplasma faecigallinarum]|nr:preprotein translocase subunit SecG [Candidatus Onthoplasma faecigallinarum]
MFLATVPNWITTSFPIFERICLVILALLCLVMIVLVFMQITGGSNTSNVITGNQDSYYAQNKAGSREGRITRLIYICLGLIAFFAILYFVFLKIPTLF